MLATIKSVELPDGVKLPFVEGGDLAGQPVVLLHGYSDSLHSYDLLLPHLSDEVRAIALTQRGHGDASRPEAGYGVSDFVDDLAAFLDALEIPSAVIIGHSMGSLIAQRFAIEHPERTSGLVLIGSFLRLQNLPDFAGFSEMISQLDDPVDPDFVRGFQESTLTRPVPTAFFDTILRESEKLAADTWKAVLRDVIANEHVGRLGRIAAPTLILWGEEDAITPRDDQDTLASSIPGATLTLYPGTGHAPHWEEPERVASDLLTFIRRAVSR